MAGTIPSRQDAVNRRRAEQGLGASRRTPAGDAFSGFVLRLIRLHGLITAAGDELARPVGQTSARWQVLAGAESGRMTVADIARALGLARQSVQRVADVLELEGLVEYRDNPRHRRARLLALSDSGKAALGAIQAAQRGWANELGAAIGEEDLRSATTVLDRTLAELGRRSMRRS